MVTLEGLPGDDLRFLFAAAVVLGGLVLGLVMGWVSRRILYAVGVDDAVEGTAIERTARGLGTSTVDVTARLVSWFIYAVAVLFALEVADIFRQQILWTWVLSVLPDLFLGALALAVGLVLGDKAEVATSEYLRGVKLPEASLIPRLVRYSVVFVAALVALSQVGVATGALLILLLVYAAALIVFGALALRDLLPASAAGIYLLLEQPYGIGDTVRIGDRQGVVQEVSVFATHLESGGEEYIVPNHVVFSEGAVRERE